MGCYFHQRNRGKLVCMSGRMVGNSLPQRSRKVHRPMVSRDVFRGSRLRAQHSQHVFIPLGMLQGADVEIYDFVVRNLIPATLGNITGGAFFVGGLYWLAYRKS